MLELQAAATSCYVATNPGLKGVSGKFFMDSNEAEPGQAAACDMQLAATYWKVSEELIASKSTDNQVLPQYWAQYMKIRLQIEVLYQVKNRYE